MQALLDGNVEEAAALRSCINATIGYEKLGVALGRSPKNLMRMLGPSGIPTAENLLGVIGVLQQEAGVRLQVRAVADAARRKLPSVCATCLLAAKRETEGYLKLNSENQKFSLTPPPNHPHIPVHPGPFRGAYHGRHET